MDMMMAPRGLRAERWAQLGLGLVCMIAISSPQYVWTLFARPFAVQFGVPLASVQITFALLILLQTFFSPFQGWLVDRFGPRLLVAAGAALTGLSWVLAARATSLLALQLSYGVLGGLGTGIVYVGVIGLAVGWFPGRRGMAAGVVAAGYGMGAIATSYPIFDSLALHGTGPTLQRFGLMLGAAGVVAALGLRRPPAPARAEHGAGMTTRAMLGSGVFWMMFLIMALMSTSGLMVVSQIGVFAAEFGVTHAVVWGAAALPLALSLDRITNGLTRPFFGLLSDRIGREPTMALAFGLEGCAMTAWLALRAHPVAFVLLSGVVFFGWGEIFSLFPSTLTDTFGHRHATRNYGFLYVAQGIGGLFGGPLAALMHEATGTWGSVFGCAIAADFCAAALAILVLAPMRRRLMRAMASV